MIYVASSFLKDKSEIDALVYNLRVHLCSLRVGS